MSSAAPTSVADDAKHRLAVAEGLLSSLDTPRGLDGARRFLENDQLNVDEARAELEEAIGLLHRFDSVRHPRGRGGKFRKSALIAVDVQNDFLPGGALGVAHGDEVVRPLLEAAKHVDVVVASGDQHPPDHMSFVKSGGPWPPHSVKGTKGAEIDPQIKAAADIIIDKGTKQDVDAYSAFDGTGLADKLRERDVGKVIVGGLATDYCVLATALDSVKEGFDTEVLPEASRAVNVKAGDGDRALEQMREAGVKVHKIKEKKMRRDPLNEGKLSAEARDKLPDSAFALPGRRYPIHDENHARNALTRVAQHGTPQEKTKVRAAVRKRHPAIEVEEARVTGNPPTPGSPSSQTTQPGAKQNEAWGGPNAGVLAQLAASGLDLTKPPNLREAEDWQACGNCVFFNRDQCMLYGIDRDGSAADLIHNGGYPVDHDDLCDSHKTVTPPDQQRIVRAQRYVERYLTEAHELAEAAAADEGTRMVMARARFDVAERRLEELGIHVFDELKHPRARGKFASKPGAHGSLGRLEDHAAAIGRMRAGEEYHVAHGVRVRHVPGNIPGSPTGHLYEISHNGRPSGGDTVASEAARKAYELASQRERALSKRTGASSREIQRRMGADIPSKRADIAKERRHAAAAGERQARVERHGRRLREGEELTEVKSSAYPGLDRSPKKNWVDKAGGLPRYIERIAKHLHYEKGKEIGHAIAIAVNVVKKMCASGDTNFPGKQSVNPKSRAEACAAVAQWERKKGMTSGKGHAGNVARSALQHADVQERFERTVALVESSSGTWRAPGEDPAANPRWPRPVPPSWNFVEKVLGEIALEEGDRDWFVGMMDLDEAEQLVEEHGLDEVVELDLVEYSVLRHLGFDPKKHPRTLKGRKGGGRFAKVLSSIQQDAEKTSALHSVMAPQGLMSAGDRGEWEKRTFGPRRQRRGERAQLPARRRNQNRPNQAGSGQRAASSATEPATWNLEKGEERFHTHYHPLPPRDQRPRLKVRTVEQHFATDESGQEHMFPDGLYTRAAQAGRQVSGQRKPSAGALPQDDLTVDLAIGGVLSTFPNVKDWDLEGPIDVGGTKHWKVHVKLADGKAHTIDVDENGHVTDLSFALGTAPKSTKPTAVAKETTPATETKLASVAPVPTSKYEATGDYNVVSHMQPGTVFKGDDQHYYKLHGDDWIMGKKGKVKAAHIENLDTGTHKSVPYFAIHGKEYPIHAPTGTFTPKAADEPTSASSAFDDLMKSVQGQTGTLESVQGKNVVITGKLPNHTRDEAFALISAAGGHPQSSVSSSTHVLVTGEKVGATKINAAKKKGITVVPWEQFKGLVEAQIGPDRTKLALCEGALVEAVGSDLVRLRARRDVLRKRVGSPHEARAREIVEALSL